ncbi:MAG: hypothetical protein WC600_06055 [Desulfobaccales bacterium]
MKPRVMRNGTVVSTLLVILLMAMGCATLETARHKYFMRGQVLEVQDGTAYLCLGTEQGAKVGQVLTVRRYVKIGGSRGGQYRVDSVGTVKITEVESHMANAKIVTGDVKPNDIVDLNIENP